MKNLFSFNFFHRVNLLPDYSFLGTDIHSHILPGIDDGAQTLTESFQLLNGLSELGFDRFYATPHVIADRYPNTPETIQSALKKITDVISNRGDTFHVEAAAEYLIDESFEHLLDGKGIMTLPGKRVLIEMPFVAPSPNMEEYIFKLQVNGLHPVMAHPERYNYWQNETEEWKRVVKLGCELQVNLLSLFGYYGKGARNRAFDLINKGWVSFLATDIHNVQQLSVLKAGLKDRSVAKLLSEHEFFNNKL
ncbi:tyrosine-protein phosphatase [Neolewinella agarilytica]|uniref:tyrosine-protein phosphatase n=1 Tax=Neolewinella agarilytica TaxID=478744 RepID=UPI0023529097|nr:CpsB/CapC family capsule biosynthesis tyrosine phosphatase [Neolewinella agarilytica]